jgi:hypothetical protein
MKPYEVLSWPGSLGPEAERLGSNTSGPFIPYCHRKVGPATITSVWRYEAANSRSGSLRSGSGAVVVVDHAAQPLPTVALHLSCRGLAKLAKSYPKSTDFFSDRGERDDPAPPLYFEYCGLGKDAILYLGGPGLHSLQFTGVPPSEIAAIFARAMKVPKAH